MVSRKFEVLPRDLFLASHWLFLKSDRLFLGAPLGIVKKLLTQLVCFRHKSRDLDLAGLCVVVASHVISTQSHVAIQSHPMKDTLL